MVLYSFAAVKERRNTTLAHSITDHLMDKYSTPSGRPKCSWLVVLLRDAQVRSSERVPIQLDTATDMLKLQLKQSLGVTKGREREGSDQTPKGFKPRKGKP